MRPKTNDSGKKMKKISVGSGPHHKISDEWETVDIRPFPGVDHVMDVTKKWSFRNVDYISGEHFLEHLALEKAIMFLVMAGNSLKIGGKIRLSTPNLTWVMLTHYRPENVNISDMLTINRAFHGWGHQFLWSSVMLEYVLNELGFINIEFYEYGKSNDPELNDIERHGGGGSYKGEPSVIIVEVTKTTKIIKSSSDFLNRLENEFLQYVRSGH